MIELRGGPAGPEGATLGCRRAPMYLRVTTVVRKGQTVFDALDQLDDVPRPHEELWAYRIVPGSWTVVFVRPGGRYESGVYEFVEPQPAEEVLRDNRRWREWANAQPAVESAERPSLEDVADRFLGRDEGRG